MKWIAFSIFVSSLIISFHYVWINRIEIKAVTSLKANESPVYTIFNKWTGNHCVFTPRKDEVREENKDLFYWCEMPSAIKITLP